MPGLVRASQEMVAPCYHFGLSHPHNGGSRGRIGEAKASARLPHRSCNSYLLGETYSYEAVRILDTSTDTRKIATDAINANLTNWLEVRILPGRFPVEVEKGRGFAGLLYDHLVSETADLWFR